VNFACERCQKRYSIADEKVQGRGFRVTCKQCGHVIVVKAAGQAPEAAAAPPAPARAPSPTSTPTSASTPTPTSAPASTSAELPPAPLFPPLPGDELDAPLGVRANDSVSASPRPQEDEHDHFFDSEPTHRPRVTAEWMLAQKKKHPALLYVLVGLGLMLVAGGVALTKFGLSPSRQDPPPAPLAARRAVEPAPPPAPKVMPALAVKAEAPAPEPAPPPDAAVLPAEAPLTQRGAQAAPRGVGGQAGFESVGGGGGDDAREKLRQRELTIAKKDKRLLDLLDKKQDAAVAPVARAELDTGRGSLDEGAVRQVMASNAASFSSCVTRAVKADPHLRVDGRRVTLNLTVKPSGVVSSAWLAEADVDKSPLGKCLLSTARRMVFPAFSGEPVDVSRPLTLSTSY
jgi:predicted Zn finger-like uncharacterized protein